MDFNTTRIASYIKVFDVCTTVSGSTPFRLNGITLCAKSSRLQGITSCATTRRSYVNEVYGSEINIDEITNSVGYIQTMDGREPDVDGVD